MCSLRRIIVSKRTERRGRGGRGNDTFMGKVHWLRLHCCVFFACFMERWLFRSRIILLDPVSADGIVDIWTDSCPSVTDKMKYSCSGFIKLSAPDFKS